MILEQSETDESPKSGGFYEYSPTVAFPQPWTKWLPTDPTSPHWYDARALQALIDAEIAHARGGESKLLRSFLTEFRGLSGTAKAKQVIAAVPTAKRLNDLNGTTPDLLAAMQAASAPANPASLGRVGETHVRAVIDREYGIVRDRFWYKQVAVLDGGIPIVIEAALAETKRPGGLVTAVNFSPAFADPLARARLDTGKVDGMGIVGFLWTCRVRPDENATVFVHIISPALSFLDRGKSQLSPSQALRDATTQALWPVAKTHWDEGQRRERDAAAAARRRTVQIRAWERAAPTVTLVDAAFAVMEEAWRKASSDGTRPASARTVFYQARPLMQELTDAEIKDTYFTQELLPRYERAVRVLPNVYYEPRGTLYEPHTGTAVPLGTREVEDYQLPDWTFDKIFFVEKTGLWPVLKQAGLGERFDMAVIAGQGLATVAARILLARAERACTIFVAHDADPTGYNIALTLAEETARMPDHRIDVVDIGLKLDDAHAWGLQTETFTRMSALPKRVIPVLGETERRLWRAGQRASKQHPVVCERVELNAFTSEQLVAYIEDALDRHGATQKVVPPEKVIAEQSTAALDKAMATRVQDVIASVIPTEAIVRTLLASATFDPNDLTRDAVRAALEAERAARDIDHDVVLQAVLDAIDAL